MCQLFFRAGPPAFSAGKKILGTRSEGDDFQVLHTDNGAGNGKEFPDFLTEFLRGADRVLGDIAPEVPHAEVIGAVEHTAVSVTAALDEVAVSLFIFISF